MPSLAALLAAVLLAVASPSVADEPAADATRAELLHTAQAYRAALDPVLGFRENEVRRASEALAQRRELLARGIVARRDVADAERRLDDARAGLDATRAAIGQAEALIAEAQAMRQLATLPPLAAGEYRTTPTLIRFSGRGPWSIADAGTIERFFAARFGHALAVSARGQTAVHDRLGFDHHDAIDVAVHPDSAEGEALMGYLRERGIPFIAFRHAVAGEATGAHIHIGRASQRLAAPLAH